MSHERETSGQIFIPFPPDENSTEAGTVEFRQEDVFLQKIIKFLDSEQGLEIPSAEIDMTGSELDFIPLEKASPEAENDGFLMLEEIEPNELFPEINQSLDLEEVFQIPCTETMNSKQDPTPGPSSGENQDLNLKENDPETEEFQEAEIQRKSRAPSKIRSNGIKKQDHSGKCCECNKVYLDIFQHNQRKHNGKLGKCTAFLDCKKYFTSVQKRVKHEQQEHQERKEFCCQFCHYSTNQNCNLKKHVRVKHSEKKIRCGQEKCGKMFASEADLKDHVKLTHKKEKCPTRRKVMSQNALYAHKRFARCRVLAAE